MKHKRTQVFLIKAETEDELAEKISSEKRDFFACQPKQKKDGSWVAFIYFEPATEKQVEYMKSLGIKIPEGLSKGLASKQIKQVAG